jgi:hypothetical protein
MTLNPVFSEFLYIRKFAPISLITGRLFVKQNKKREQKEK